MSSAVAPSGRLITFIATAVLLCLSKASERPAVECSDGNKLGVLAFGRRPRLVSKEYRGGAQRGGAPTGQIELISYPIAPQRLSGRSSYAGPYWWPSPAPHHPYGQAPRRQ